MNRLAQMLHLYRAAHRLTARDLEKEIGIAASTISRVEQGKTMELETYLKLQTWFLAAPATSIPTQEVLP